MQLWFRFEGQDGGKITIWWDHPWRYRNSHLHHKFGLGAVEVIHNLKAFRTDMLARMSLWMCFLSIFFNCFRCWGWTWGLSVYQPTLGLNTVSRVMNYWAAAWISIFLWISPAVVSCLFACLQEDPDSFSEQDYGDVMMDLETTRWMNPDY